MFANDTMHTEPHAHRQDSLTGSLPVEKTRPEFHPHRITQIPSQTHLVSGATSVSSKPSNAQRRGPRRLHSEILPHTHKESIPKQTHQELIESHVGKRRNIISMYDTNQTQIQHRLKMEYIRDGMARYRKSVFGEGGHGVVHASVGSRWGTAPSFVDSGGVGGDGGITTTASHAHTATHASMPGTTQTSHRNIKVNNDGIHGILPPIDTTTKPISLPITKADIRDQIEKAKAFHLARRLSRVSGSDTFESTASLMSDVTLSTQKPMDSVTMPARFNHGVMSHMVGHGGTMSHVMGSHTIEEEQEESVSAGDRGGMGGITHTKSFDGGAVVNHDVFATALAAFARNSVAVVPHTDTSDHGGGAIDANEKSVAGTTTTTAAAATGPHAQITAATSNATGNSQKRHSIASDKVSAPPAGTTTSASQTRANTLHQSQSFKLNQSRASIDMTDTEGLHGSVSHSGSVSTITHGHYSQNHQKHGLRRMSVVASVIPSSVSDTLVPHDSTTNMYAGSGSQQHFQQQEWGTHGIHKSDSRRSSMGLGNSNTAANLMSSIRRESQTSLERVLSLTYLMREKTLSIERYEGLASSFLGSDHSMHGAARRGSQSMSMSSPGSLNASQRRRESIDEEAVVAGDAVVSAVKSDRDKSGLPVSESDALTSTNKTHNVAVADGGAALPASMSMTTGMSAVAATAMRVSVGPPQVKLHEEPRISLYNGLKSVRSITVMSDDAGSRLSETTADTRTIMARASIGQVGASSITSGSSGIISANGAPGRKAACKQKSSFLSISSLIRQAAKVHTPAMFLRHVQKRATGLFPHMDGIRINTVTLTPRERWRLAIRTVIKLLQSVRHVPHTGPITTTTTATTTSNSRRVDNAPGVNERSLAYVLKEFQHQGDFILSMKIQHYLDKRTHRNEEDIAMLNRLIMTRCASFAKFNYDQRIRFCESMSYEAHRKGAVVIRQGHAPQCFYFVLSGQVEVLKDRSDGFAGQLRLTLLNQGDCFGEVALDGSFQERRTTTVVCTAPSEFLRVDKDVYRSIVIGEDSESDAMMRLNMLRNIPVFSLADEQTLEQAVPRTQICHYERNSTILRENETNRRLFFIVTGKCRVEKQIPLLRKSIGKGEYRVKPDCRESMPVHRGEERIQEKVSLADIFAGASFPEPLPAGFIGITTIDRLDLISKINDHDALSLNRSYVSVVAIKPVVCITMERIDFARIMSWPMLNALMDASILYSIPLRAMQDQWVLLKNWEEYKRKIMEDILLKRAGEKWTKRNAMASQTICN